MVGSTYALKSRSTCYLSGDEAAIRSASIDGAVLITGGGEVYSLQLDGDSNGFTALLLDDE
ncbi:MAG: hypothetical protein ABJF23_27555 [Bryobacteraceae bacterium]